MAKEKKYVRIVTIVELERDLDPQQLAIQIANRAHTIDGVANAHERSWELVGEREVFPPHAGN